MSVLLGEDVVAEAHRHRAKAREIEHLGRVKLLPDPVAGFLVDEGEIDDVLKLGEVCGSWGEVVEVRFLAVSSGAPDVSNTGPT